MSSIGPMRVLAQNPRFHLNIITRRWGPISFEAIRRSVISITVTHSVTNIAGTFQITLKPEPIKFLFPGLLPFTYPARGSWEDVFNPMDYIEIYISTQPGSLEDREPLMRGLVDTVSRRFNIAGNEPHDSFVVLAGRDFGKLLLMTKCYYLAESTDGFPELEVFRRWKDGLDRIFQTRGEYGEGAAKTESDPNFVQPVPIIRTIFNEFFLEQMRVVFQGFPSQEAIPFLDLEVEIDPDQEARLRTFHPAWFQQNWNPFNDVFTLMRQYAHMPWRELIVREAWSHPILLYRTTPWLNEDGQQVQPFTESVATWDFTDDNRVGSDLARSDERIHNFFFTYAGMFGSYGMMVKRYGNAAEGLMPEPLYRSNPYLMGLGQLQPPGTIGPFPPSGFEEESAWQRHGIRILEVPTQYMNVDMDDLDRVVATRLAEARAQGVIENIRLAHALGHAGILEWGAFTLKGEVIESIRHGDYIRHQTRPGMIFGQGPVYYVESTVHEFRQGTAENDGLWQLVVGVGRGRGYLARLHGNEDFADTTPRASSDGGGPITGRGPGVIVVPPAGSIPSPTPPSPNEPTPPDYEGFASNGMGFDVADPTQATRFYFVDRSANAGRGPTMPAFNQGELIQIINTPNDRSATQGDLTLRITGPATQNLREGEGGWYWDVPIEYVSGDLVAPFVKIYYVIIGSAEPMEGRYKRGVLGPGLAEEEPPDDFEPAPPLPDRPTHWADAFRAMRAATGQSLVFNTILPAEATVVYLQGFVWFTESTPLHYQWHAAGPPIIGETLTIGASQYRATGTSAVNGTADVGTVLRIPVEFISGTPPSGTGMVSVTYPTMLASGIPPESIDDRRYMTGEILTS